MGPRILRGGHSLDMSQVHSGENNAIGENGSKTGTYRKTSQGRRQGGRKTKVPHLQVSSQAIQRSDNQMSLLSARRAGSALSAFSFASNATEVERSNCHDNWEVFEILRDEQKSDIELVLTEMDTMPVELQETEKY